MFPTTSQPSAAAFLKEYQKAFEEGYESIIAILLSSKLSGTYNSALIAKDILEDKRITVIDSLQAASNLRFLVEDAINMVKEGILEEEIVKTIKEKRKNMSIYLTVDTLEYLRRGGRLSGIQSTIGEMLNIKPIIQLIDGELKLLDKVRGKKKALKSLSDKVQGNVERIAICHILNEEEALKLKEELESRYPNIPISIDELGPVIGCHIGPKGIGICFY